MNEEQRKELARLDKTTDLTRKELAAKFNTSLSSVARAIKKYANVEALPVYVAGDKVCHQNGMTGTIVKLVDGETDLYELKYDANDDIILVSSDMIIMPHIINEQSIILVHQSGTKSIDVGHHNFDKVKDAITNKEWQDAVLLMDEVFAITEYSKGKIVVKDGQVVLAGHELHNTLTARIIDEMNKQSPDTSYLDNLLAFLENVMENPSFRAVNSLYDFLEHNDIEITEDGHFLAWRGVTSDFKDYRTKTMDNSVGQVLSMPRNEVNEDPEQTCSNGLHVAAKHYIDTAWNCSNVIKVKVNPRDVVAVPNDYQNSKMRVCRFEVMEVAND